MSILTRFLAVVLVAVLVLPAFAVAAASPTPVASVPVVNIVCSDSDSGRNYLVAGSAAETNYVTGITRRGTDACVDPDTGLKTGSSAYVKEFYCSGTRMYAAIERCAEGLVCDGGRCVVEATPAPLALPCTDSDGGRGRWLAGTTLREGVGYFVKVRSECTLENTIPSP